MKYIILLLTTLACAQKKDMNYSITYASTFAFKIDSTLSKDQQIAYKKAFEKETLFQLLVNDTLSFYKEIPKIDNSPQSSISFSVSSNQKSILNNYADSTTQYLVDIPKKMIIKGALDTIPWRITEKKDTICGMPVILAKAKARAMFVEAYFTESIKSKAGPLHFWGLPGMLLSVKTFKTKKDKDVSYSLIKCKSIALEKKAIKPYNNRLDVMKSKEYDIFVRKLMEKYNATK